MLELLDEQYVIGDVKVCEMSLCGGTRRKRKKPREEGKENGEGSNIPRGPWATSQTNRRVFEYTVDPRVFQRERVLQKVSPRQYPWRSELSDSSIYISIETPKSRFQDLLDNESSLLHLPRGFILEKHLYEISLFESLFIYLYIFPPLQEISRRGTHTEIYPNILCFADSSLAPLAIYPALNYIFFFFFPSFIAK